MQPGGMVFEIGNQMAADLGVEADFVDMPWKDQIGALESGAVDVCLKLTNTPERARRIAFTSNVPLLVYRGVLFAREGIGTHQDLSSFRGRVAATEGSLHAGIAERSLPLAEVVLTSSATESMRMLAAGDVDIVHTDDIVSCPPSMHVLSDTDGNQIVLSTDASYPSTRLGEHDFRLWLEQWMIFHSRQGTILRLINRAKEEHGNAFG